MSENTPTLEEWRELYEDAIRVKELAPWGWMAETDVFGVQNPETDELGFASVMGALGEHYSIAVYLGPEGLYGLWDFEDPADTAPVERLLEIPHLQASFEDRKQLHDKDREVIKALGLKFRGRNAWPMFRSYRPGFVPWFLEAKEARFLAIVLEQVLDVAPRIRENRSLLEPSSIGHYLVRVPSREGDTLSWQERTMDVPPPELPSVSLYMDMPALERLKHLPHSQSRVEIDFPMFPVATRKDKDARPVFPYMLLTVEAQSGFVLGSDLLTADPSLEAMWGQIPVHVVYHLARLGMVPREVTVRSRLLLQLLQPLAEELRFRLRQSDTLRSLDQAKEFLLQRFM